MTCPECLYNQPPPSSDHQILYTLMLPDDLNPEIYWDVPIHTLDYFDADIHHRLSHEGWLISLKGGI